MLIVGFNALAYDFEEDGIFYNILSAEDLTCEVTSGINEYSGAVMIPETVLNQEKNYKVITIGNDAFYRCESLTSVGISNSVVSIGNNAFYSCTGMTSATIGAGIATIGGYAFSGCSGLKEIKVSNENQNYCDIDGVLFDKSKTRLVQYPGGLVGAYTIPESVAEIGIGAFYRCDGLTSVVISNSVTTIGESAFWDCGGLVSVIVGNGVSTIGNYAFYSCTGLASLSIGNSVSTIGDYAFRGCSGLKEIKVDNENQKYCDIEGVLFDKSKTLLVQYPGGLVGAYTIPNSVSIVGDYAFEGCGGLTSVYIPNSVTTIGDYAFEVCGGLTSVVVSNSVTTIGDYGFEGCENLTSVTIGNSVQTIGDGAFEGCSSLVEINSLNPVPPIITPETFYEAHFLNGTLNVEKGALNAYKEAPEWKNFLNIQEKDFGGVETVCNDELKVFVNDARITVVGADENAVVEVFNLSGQLVTRGYGNEFEVSGSGIYIVRIAEKIFKVAVK